MAAAIRDGSLSPVALVDACLARIRAVEPKILAWVHLDEAGARAEAALREAEARQGRFRGPLHGVPVGVKDIFHVAGMPTAAGARPWAHTRPTHDAEAVRRLRRGGAIVLGKTATTQFAYRDPARTRNPWNLDHTPGGSSSGSAAAVATRMVPLALGSQTVGSVLRPAAYCGVVGWKGPHGAIRADGVIPLAWSLDHVGVLARSVADVRLALGVLGPDVRLAMRRPPRFALAPEILGRAEPAVAAEVRRAATLFAGAGAAVEEVKLPGSFAEIHAAGQVILEAEAATFHESTYRLHADEYGEGIRGLVEAGLARTAAEYVRADRARRRFRDEATRLLAGYDALLSPTAPAPAPPGLAWTGDATLCAPWSSAGFPAISIPTGLAPSGLPQALQLVAIPLRVGILLDVAGWGEAVLGFDRSPEP
jgi:aspartyl-tRNA(Asn)/glutamyl-tRNA(Gln) amidotransferase subunit A